jgi:hypothetical protein
MRLKILFHIKPVLLSLLVLASSPSLQAQQSNDQVDSIPCLSLSRILSVDIIDNEHLVFQTGINDYYLNTLPYACNGLRLNDSFIYETSINQICDYDVITVMHNSGLGDKGPSCGLGQFVAINKQEMKALRQELLSK